MKGFPMQSSVSALKQTTQASPMKVASPGGVYLGGKQVASSEVEKRNEELDAVQEYMKQIEIDNPGQSREYYADEADRWLEARDPEKYGQFGYSGKYGSSKRDAGDTSHIWGVDFTGLENYTNELSPNYDPEIKTVQDIKNKYSEVDETGGKVIRDGLAFEAVKHEEGEFAGSDNMTGKRTYDKTKVDKETDRQRRLEME